MNNNLHKNGINIETPNFSSSGDSSSSNTYQSTEEKKAEDDRKIARLEQQMERIAELRDELIAKRVQAVKEAAEEAASKGPSSSSSSSSSTSLSNTEEDYLDRQYKEKHTKLNQLVERRERALLDESLLRRCHKAAARALTVISAPTPRQITDVERQSGYMQHYLKGWIKERKKQRQQQREQMEEEEVEEEEEVSEEDGVRLGEMQPLQRRPFVEADVIDASATTISKS